MNRNRLEFKQKDVDEAIQEYNQLQMDPVQKQILIETADILAESVGMNTIAMRGFVWMTVRDWQTIHKKPFSEIRNLPPEERLTQVLELAKLVTKRLSKSLKNVEDQFALTDALTVAIENYKKKLMYK